jgi:hypothetical protein
LCYAENETRGKPRYGKLGDSPILHKPCCWFPCDRHLHWLGFASSIAASPDELDWDKLPDSEHVKDQVYAELHETMNDLELLYFSCGLALGALFMLSFYVPINAFMYNKALDGFTGLMILSVSLSLLLFFAFLLNDIYYLKVTLNGFSLGFGIQFPLLVAADYLMVYFGFFPVKGIL